MGENEEYFQPAEVRARIGMVTGELRRRLVKTGDRFAQGLDCSGEELYQEACAKVLDGIRRWRIDLAVEVFLIGAMRSLANERRKALQRGPVDYLNKDSEEFEAALNSMPAGELDDPGYRLEKVELSIRELRELQEYFKDDPEVMLIMTFRALGDEQRETMEYTGMGEKDYLAALKRLQRRKAEMRKDESDG